jgi:hypothetical protein
MTLERLKKIAAVNDGYGIDKRVIIYCDENEVEALDKMIRSTPATESVEFKGTLNKAGLFTMLVMYCGYDFHFIGI